MKRSLLIVISLCLLSLPALAEAEIVFSNKNKNNEENDK